MDKKRKAAICAVISYLNMENEKTTEKQIKKDSYKNLYFEKSSSWQDYGIRNIMSGHKNIS
jgi:hypothetical protein